MELLSLMELGQFVQLSTFLRRSFYRVNSGKEYVLRILAFCSNHCFIKLFKVMRVGKKKIFLMLKKKKAEISSEYVEVISVEDVSIFPICESS